jgi:Phosphotransferase enzyme family
MAAWPPELDEWCARWLGSPPQSDLFASVGMSRVLGLRLVDGRDVVLKVRRAEARLYGCAAAHRHLWQAGYPCSELLVGPVPIGDDLATAERYVPGGVQLEPTVETAEQYAWALAELIRLSPPPFAVPSLEPPPPWAWWNYAGACIWPWQSATERALSATRGWPRPDVPPERAWLEDLATRARARLSAFHAPAVIGHADWWVDNVRWLDGKLHVVHDWDSLAAQPEAVICGFAASMFGESMGHWVQANLAQSEAFITGYERARGRVWSDEEREVCWAAGLWLESYDISASIGDVPKRAALLEAELVERLRLAGL